MQRIIVLLLFCGFFLSGIARADSAAVIVRTDTQVQTLSRYQLVSIFSLHQQRWPDGTPVHLFVLPERHPTHFEFLNADLSLFSYQLKQRWDRAVFAGMASMPVEVADEAEMVRKVQTVKGAIGYVSKDKLPADGVRIVEVEHAN